jgi:stage II sporulation protein AB (anti-sigma F factor)
MTGDTVMKKVKLALSPQVPLVELEARKAAMEFAESMRMSPDRIDEVGGAVVEACINAVEHSHSEKVHMTLEALGHQDPEKLRVTVRDFGVGFSVEDVESQWPRGHGLNIMRGLMDEVEIHSRPGEGTTIVMSKMR